LTSFSWSDNNQKYLANSIEQIRIHLERHIAISDGKLKDWEKEDEKVKDSNQLYSEWKNDEHFPPPAIETIANLFGLSHFEKSSLLLCAGVELNSEISKLCSKVHGNPDLAYPTFGLALATLPHAHWSAITPVSPLRRFRLIELSSRLQTPMIKTPIQIEERVLHYLTGISYLDRLMQGILKPVRVAEASLVTSHRHLGERILQTWKKKNKVENVRQLMLLSPVQLCGSDETSKLILAKWLCNVIGLDLWQMPNELIPTKTDELEIFTQILIRETSLLGCGIYISSEDTIEHVKQRYITRLVDSLPGPVFLGTHQSLPALNSSAISVEIKKPLKSEQREIWKEYLDEQYPDTIDDSEISRLVSQFDLNSSAICTAASEAILSLERDDPNLLDLSVWESARATAGHRMGDLAQQILPKAKLDDLALPDAEKELLRTISIHVKQRSKVYEEWAFETISGGGGLGITALFSGESGTGKTMAAEALANDLQLNLFRIDLSMIVNKYIGETEKNLRKVFDAAEEGGAILFFDEADALFGKRSEIKDSHDRYANIEVGYLLQRMEDYRGLAILATNMKNSLDSAFLRRIRFIIDFPFPDEKSRAKIWQRIFPKSAPTNGLNMNLLTQLNITGGHIRNIALNALFLAADQGSSVNMTHLKQAAQTEYDKLGRHLSTTELRNWS
jgi:AAA+ superfamily predicted ATPase